MLRNELGWYRLLLVDLPLFLGATGIISRFYILAQREIYADWKTRLKYLPAVLALGMGISLNNARGVIQALIGYQTPFQRTPKYQVENKNNVWKEKSYRLRKNRWSYLEMGMGIYLLTAIGYTLQKEWLFPVPFLILFSFGFFYVGGVSLFQSLFDLRHSSIRSCP